MTDFAAWRYENLVQFAVEANERLALLNAEIDALNADLKTAINAYRDLLRRDAPVLFEATHPTETKQTGE
jgi:uncharacterized small protein (DUF1192 family)